MDDLKKKKAIENYWLRKLRGDLPKISLPFLNEKGVSEKSKKELTRVKVPEPITAKLKEISDNVDLALFILIFSALNIVIYKYTGLEDLVIGTVTPKKENVKDKIILSRNRISREMIFREIINRVQQGVLEDFNHSDYSFGLVYHKLLTGKGLDHVDVFNVACIYDKLQNKSNILEQFGLVLVLKEFKNELSLEAEYDTNRCDGEMIRRFCRNLIYIFDNISGKIDREIAGISIVSAREKQELFDFNRRHLQVEYPQHKTIHELFEQQVEKTPHHIAVVGHRTRCALTYRELNKRSNRLARVLRGKGVGPGTIVGILMERSIEAVQGMLGILKAGAAYLPIDGDLPTGRVTAMLDDSSAAFLLTQDSIVDKHAFIGLQGLGKNQLKPHINLSRPALPILDFDELPFVDRSLIDCEKYNRYIGQSIVKNRILIQASRGCPYNCAYCYRIWPRQQAARSGENIFKEILFYYHLGIRKFDIFMLNIKSGKRLFELIIENNLEDIELYFPNGFRGDLLTREYIDLMVKAGTVNFALALETASPRLQKLINKNLNLEKFKEMIEYVCREYPQVILELFTMHGIPTETREEALMTLDFIKSLKWVHFPYVNVLKIYQHTPMEKLALENGISRESILRSENMAWHEWSDTLPFDKNFTSRYQVEFLSQYLLSKERLLQVLPYQMKTLTEDEFVQKYDSYFPGDIKSFADFLKYTGLEEHELRGLRFRDTQEDEAVLHNLNERIAAVFPAKQPSKNAFRVLLLDLSQFFSHTADMLYDVVDPPLGLMYILTYLNAQLGDKINGRILKPRIDFDSYEELKLVLEEFKPQVIGIRTLSYYKDFFHRTVAVIRQWGVDVPIITGGPYATVDYETILQDRNIDLAVLGEGEITFCELTEKIMANHGKLPDNEVLEKITGIAFVPKTKDTTNGFKYFTREILFMDQLNGVLTTGAEKSAENLENINRSSDPAYIIFTSGSTGKPKGVIVEHKNVVNVLSWFGRTYQLQKDSHVVQLTNFAFDPSVEQIFSTLVHGSTVYIAAKELIANKDQFHRFMEENQIHIINFVPGTLGELLGGGKKLESLQAVIPGGEKLEESVKNRLLEKGYPVYNQYGPTETTIDALMAKCTKNKVNLGQPISNVSCYILDKNNNLVPIGTAGELYIAGAGVARGYLNRPELTAEKFICLRRPGALFEKTAPGPHKNFLLKGSQKKVPGKINHMSYRSHRSYVFKKRYKTGDLARWLPEGNIEFLGRKDHQVKIRGQRIELGEIETILQKHDKIKEAVVTLQGNIQENVHLCAYIVPYPGHSSRLTDSELRDFLSRELAEYMVPAHFVTMEAFPLLPSGKVDRESLPHPGETGSENEVEYTAPENETEKKLVEVWEHVLGRIPIGTNENFFAIGGDSITSIQIVSRMNEAGYKVEMSDIFKYPTISQLGPRVRELRQHKPPDQSLVTGIVPLTPVQEEFFQKNKIEPHHFNHAVMFHSSEGFDEEAVRAVFLKIQEHHDALRMTFREKDGEIIQTNHELEYPFSLQIYDFRGQKGAAGVLEIKANEIQASIDLATGPLMKLGLFHMDDGDRLLIVIHHLVIDGVSWRILFNDIESLFRQYKKGEPLVLPAKTDSFKLWAEKLSGYANSPLLLKEKHYWAHLESKEIPGIKKDFQYEYNYIKDADTLSFHLTKEETGKLLTKVNQAFRTEINDILLTALGLGIRETYGLHQVLAALEGHGREEIIRDANTHRTVGWFTSVYPVLLDVSFANNLSRQIKEIKESLRRIPNKGIGYGILKYLTANENKTGIDFKLDPQISFNYLGQFDRDVEQMSFVMAKESTGNQQSIKAQREYQLDVTGIITNQQLVISIIYNKKQYEPENIKRLLQNYEAALSRIISFCSALKKSEPTPADFTYKGLSIEAVEAIAASSEGEIEDIYTLSPMQAGMLFQALFDTSSSAYFEQMSYRLHGKLDEIVVEKSLNELFKRYDILRTFFLHKGLERPVQVVLKHRKVDFYYKDLAGIISREEKEQFITEFKEKDRQRSFDLSKDVLMRVAVIKPADTEYEFTWSHHHILMDGWCTGILIPEFFEIYNSYLEKRPYQLPAVAPYRIYIQWLEEQNEEEAKNYWKNYLEGYEGTAVVPTFGSTGSIAATKKDVNLKAYKNELVFITLEKEKTIALNDLAAANQVTLNTILQTLWGIILGMYNGKQDVVFGGVVSGRPSQIPGVESMVGLFINTIPVRIKYEDKPTFSRLLGKVQKEALENERYHYYPLAKIQTLTPQKQNLLDHIAALQNFPAAREIKQAMDKNKNEKNSTGAVLKLSDFEAFEQIHYDFGVVFVPGDQLEIRLNYNAHVYERNAIERIANHFILVFNQVLNHGNAEWFIDELTLMSEEEKNRVLYDFNNTEAEYPANKTLHQLFAGQAAKNPDNIAVVGPSQIKNRTYKSYRTYISYRELNEKTNQLAHLLTQKGVRPDTIVAIMVERSTAMIVGILGILKAGGAYLPIDPEYPQERIDYILKDSNASILLTHEDITPSPSTLTSTLTCQVSPANLAYIIYTSGTTGTPKGSVMEHRNVVSLMFHDNYLFDFDSNDVWTMFHSYCFDFSVWEMYGALLYGGKLLLISKMTARDPQKYLEILKTDKVTILNQTPGAFYQLAQQELDSPGKNLRLKYVIFGGEALIPAKLKPWKEKYPGTKLINMFGITETTVHVTFKEIEDKDIQLNISNIGTPLPTLNTYVMDNHQKLMPIGIAGELCVSGQGVCRGYLNRPELTKEKFLTDSHPAGKSKRLYRSGDLGKFTINGELEYLGRIDHQVKIRGYRIELAEIESQLLDHAEIKEAVVVANEEKNREKYLCAYIVPVEPDAVNVSELRKYLLEKLPGYMVPGHFVNIEKIPLTANGKVDRKTLEGYGTKLDTGVEYAAPRNKMEKIIADTWKKVLKLEKVSIHDNFFDLGGNSLSIIRINHQLNEVLEKELSIVAMFEYPTIESLSVYLTQTGTRESSKEKEIEQFDELNDDAFNMMEQTLGIIGKSKDE